MAYAVKDVQKSYFHGSRSEAIEFLRHVEGKCIGDIVQAIIKHPKIFHYRERECSRRKRCADEIIRKIEFKHQEQMPVSDKDEDYTWN